MRPESYIKIVTERIKRNIQPKKIILFGSYAYGNPQGNSDIDLFLLIDSEEKPAKRRIKVSKLFLDRTYPLDFVVYTPGELKERLSMNDAFIKEIINKGKVLYEE